MSLVVTMALPPPGSEDVRLDSPLVSVVVYHPVQAPFVEKPRLTRAGAVITGSATGLDATSATASSSTAKEYREGILSNEKCDDGRMGRKEGFRGNTSKVQTQRAEGGSS